MKIAIASDGKTCCEHFGHCEGFKIFDVENNKIINEGFIQNPGHKPGFLPMFLREKKVNLIIAGGMGARAQELFNENNISVIVGASGNIYDIINNYINGNVKSNNSVCNKHVYEGHCED